jgi:hypothetical protein
MGAYFKRSLETQAGFSRKRVMVVRVDYLPGAAGRAEDIPAECAAGRRQAVGRSRRAAGDREVDLRQRCGSAEECEH